MSPVIGSVRVESYKGSRSSFIFSIEVEENPKENECPLSGVGVSSIGSIRFRMGSSLHWISLDFLESDSAPFLTAKLTYGNGIQANRVDN